MTGFKVTCLLSADENHGEEVRVLATRRTFETREDAIQYAVGVAPGRLAEVVPADECDAPSIYELR